MSSIKVDSLSPAGLEMMQNSESFLTELGDVEDKIYGGGDSRITVTIISSVPCGLGALAAVIVYTVVD
ncbi:hypothetical protein Lepto7375DRAFT_0671 [Leptolyngbya sp. PCC 7375]|nr:hypothetical protein Lepto7375DRAFT_0671 [Leptolyngbya sp. PCC 7375]